jgi:transposase InsO family protein
VKFAAIADWAQTSSFDVKYMCEQLGVSRSGYYAWLGRGPSARDTEDARLTLIILGVVASLNGNPGRRRVRAELRARGEKVGMGRVHKLMTAAGLQGRHPRAWRKTTIKAAKARCAPDLIGRDFTATETGTRLVGDITYVKTWDGWAFLATVIDLFNRQVVGWAIANHMRTELVIEAMQMAITHGHIKPGAIFHSDQGAQYTSENYAQFCKQHNIMQSMGRTGNCFDNAVAESFFATYKKELIHTRPWATLKQLRIATFEWICAYYNTKRRHSTLGYLTPAEYRLGYRTLEEINQPAA